MSTDISPDLLSQGLNLLIFGMGIVVVFLTLLVVATTAMSKFVQQFFPEPEIVEVSKPLDPRINQSDSIPDSRTLKIIQEAVNQHRNR